MNKEASKAINLLGIKPVRNVRSESSQDGTVVLIVPKFRDGFFSRWFQPHLAKPEFRLKLDAYGSFLWNACDGKTTIEDIAQQMSTHFGEEKDSLYERIAKFMRKLDESKFILLGEPSTGRVDS